MAPIFRTFPSNTFMLHEAFVQLVLEFTKDEGRAEHCWLEIERHYAAKGRHYHNLNHLENIFERLTEVHNMLLDFKTLLFSICFHDIIYNPRRSDNEAKSAKFAKSILTSIGYPSEKTERCLEQILATRHHQTSPNSDTNYFTDADLSILGAPDEEYQKYCQQIRKEYAIYPDFFYKPGRRKVIDHFLAMEKIFKTLEFRNRFEAQARRNLLREREVLQR